MNAIAEPLVSVIVATHNRPRILDRTLRAIAEQRLQEIEVLVMDDGSGAEALEETRAVVDALDPRFKLFPQRTPLVVGSGPSANRNRGLRAASGRYIAFCDDDDRWIDPDFLLDGTQALEQSGERLLFGNQLTEKGGEIVARDWMPAAHRATNGKSPLGETGAYVLSRAEILQRPGYAHLNFTLAERDLILEVGALWEDVRFAEDVDLFVRLADRCERILFRPKPGAVHVANAGQGRSSASADVDSLRQRLLEDAVWQHVICHCRSADAVRYALGSACVNKKMLVERVKGQGNRRGAAILARQALALVPSLKWAGYTALLNLLKR